MAIRFDEDMSPEEWKAEEERDALEQQKRDESIARFAHDHPEAVDVLDFLIDSEGR